MTFNNEIEKVKSEIKVLQSKLEFLEELENTKTPAEEAYKNAYGNYPMSEPFWVVFKKGYEAHQSLPESNDWKTVALCFGELLSSVGPNGYYNMTADQWLEWAKNTYTSLLAMEESPPPPPEVTTENVILKAYKATFGKFPTVGPSASEFDIQSWNIFQYGFRFGSGELQSLVDDVSEESVPKESTPNKYFERILNAPIDGRGYIDLREPASEFRQKLFDGIKSVFYDPEYERTHWSVKVNMAVDEVLTHFEDILPTSQDPIYDDTDKGWNVCLSSIKMNMEKKKLE
jgi:hypothetical protein